MRDRLMERIVRKSNDFASAAEWDIEQQVAMTPQERMKAAHALKERVYGANTKDVRACPNVQRRRRHK